MRKLPLRYIMVSTGAVLALAVAWFVWLSFQHRAAVRLADELVARYRSDFRSRRTGATTPETRALYEAAAYTHGNGRVAPTLEELPTLQALAGFLGQGPQDLLDDWQQSDPTAIESLISGPVPDRGIPCQYATNGALATMCIDICTISKVIRLLLAEAAIALDGEDLPRAASYTAAAAQQVGVLTRGSTTFEAQRSANLLAAISALASRIGTDAERRAELFALLEARVTELDTARQEAVVTYEAGCLAEELRRALTGGELYTLIPEELNAGAADAAAVAALCDALQEASTDRSWPKWENGLLATLQPHFQRPHSVASEWGLRYAPVLQKTLGGIGQNLAYCRAVVDQLSTPAGSQSVHWLAADGNMTEVDPNDSVAAFRMLEFQGRRWKF
ncbi:MAG: hypothetical protein JXO22_16295 [Phycisphaerae bacterium]|nr:hypothetical protein [Phycisphaerae bacterium]